MQNIKDEGEGATELNVDEEREANEQSVDDDGGEGMEETSDYLQLTALDNENEFDKLGVPTSVRYKPFGEAHISPVWDFYFELCTPISTTVTRSSVMATPETGKTAKARPTHRKKQSEALKTYTTLCRLCLDHARAAESRNSWMMALGNVAKSSFNAQKHLLDKHKNHPTVEEYFTKKSEKLEKRAPHTRKEPVVVEASFHSTVLLTSAAAQRALEAAEQEAISNGWKVSIVIADAGGVPLLAKRCDGAFAASYEIAVGKAKTAAQFSKSTGRLEEAVNVSDGVSRTSLLSAPFVLMRGGVPIFIKGKCCGAVGVSGEKPEEDEQVAMTAAEVIERQAGKRGALSKYG